MGQTTVHIETERDRAQAALWVSKAPIGTYVRFKHNKRSVDQNSRMWAMLSAVSAQIVHLQGQGFMHVSSVGGNMLPFVTRYSDEDWKDYFGHALKRGRWMPCEEGGMIPLAVRTSEMDKQEHSDLTMMVEEFAARYGVELGEPEKREPRAA